MNRSSKLNSLLFSLLFTSIRYLSMPQVTVFPFLSACVMMRSSLVEIFISASRFFVILSCGKCYFLWFSDVCHFKCLDGWIYIVEIECVGFYLFKPELICSFIVSRISVQYK